ncbi:MAG: patatin-like phospholipase family protein [Candidatus Omnitrophica bacterium]|nr:patatin-like phospholipase family protein [Candidatus Omnitrophota bacterium]
MDLDDILKKIPLFKELKSDDYQILKERIQIVDYRKGEIIYREGDPPNAFFCIISGRVKISTQNPDGTENILEYLHRGKYFGMISLLTGEPHSVTAQTINDCLIIKIEKNDFDYILRKIPSLAIDLSLTLSRRLKRKDIHQKTIFESTVISVFSAASGMGKTLYTVNLSLGLKRETDKSVIILSLSSKDTYPIILDFLELDESSKRIDISQINIDVEELKDYILNTDYGIDLLCIFYNLEDESGLSKLLGILSILVNDYHYILLDLPSALDKEVFSILNQSDIIHILSGPDILELKRTRHLIERLKKEFEFREEKIDILINDYRLSPLNHQERIKILEHSVFATLPHLEFNNPKRIFLDTPDCEYSKVIKRISRQLGEVTLGIALGVGAAYGLCHIGVLRVIEEKKINVDMISGSSIGALIASLWAIGLDSYKIEEITKEFKDPKKIIHLLDLGFPRLGFIRGRRIYNFLKRYLGNKTFYDVKLPLRILATNVKTKESIIIDRGSLLDAVMASCAIPGIFRPVRFEDELLLDGGIFNPLPVEALVKSGIKKIIAVNVTPSREDLLKAYDKIKEKKLVPSQIRKRFGIFGWKWDVKEIFKVNIFDFIFGSIEIMQSEIAKKEESFADIILHPDTSGLNWLEFHKAEEFIRRGEREARDKLPRIEELIKE